MKIIFDSEEQKKHTIDETCPSTFDSKYPGDSHLDCSGNCEKCWSEHVELEVKHD